MLFSQHLPVVLCECLVFEDDNTDTGSTVQHNLDIKTERDWRSTTEAHTAAYATHTLAMLLHTVGVNTWGILNFPLVEMFNEPQKNPTQTIQRVLKTSICIYKLSYLQTFLLPIFLSLF